MAYMKMKNGVMYLLHFLLTIGTSYGFYWWLCRYNSADLLGETFGYIFALFVFPTIALCFFGFVFKLVLKLNLTWVRFAMLLLTYSVAWNIFWVVAWNSCEM